MTNCFKGYAVRTALCLMFLTLCTPRLGDAQLNSNSVPVVLTATLLEALTVTALPGAVNFNLSPGGTADGSLPVAITTTWVLGPSRTTVGLYGSFASSTVALTDGLSHNIPSSALLGAVTTGLPTTFTAFTQTGPFGSAGASLKLFNQSVGLANLTSLRNDQLNLRIDLTSLPNTPAGVYVGTLNIQAQAL